MAATADPTADHEPFSADGTVVDGRRVGVVISHGFTGTPASMRPWALHLADAGYSVRLPLLPGHGGTWQQTNRTRWPQWYGAIEDAYLDLAQTCDTVFACGLSMGGTLVTRLAEQHPDGVAGLVLVNPAYGTQRFDAKLAPYIAWAVRSRPSIGGDIKKAGVVEEAADRTPVIAFASLSKLWKRTVADLPKITAPILLYRSREDHVVDPLSAQLLHRGAVNTTIREVVLDDSYHVATLDNDAPLVFDGSVEFIRSLSDPVPTGEIGATSLTVPGPHERVDNGLRALAYVPLTDVDADLGRQLLTSLARARIAAYLGALEAADDQRRLFVAAEERVDARTIVRATVRALGSSADELPDAEDSPVSLAKTADPLAGLDTEAVFAELVADWHVDTHAAIRRAERDLTREDADWRARLARETQQPVDDEPEWLDDDHYVPPPPPPLPRLSMPAVLGIVILLLSITLLAAGTLLGLPDNVARVLGIAGLLVGVGVLLTRVRDFHRDEDDDGAAL